MWLRLFTIAIATVSCLDTSDNGRLTPMIEKGNSLVEEIQSIINNVNSSLNGSNSRREY
jgi:hypothetical protein